MFTSKGAPVSHTRKYLAIMVSFLLRASENKNQKVRDDMSEHTINKVGVQGIPKSYFLSSADPASAITRQCISESEKESKVFFMTFSV